MAIRILVAAGNAFVRRVLGVVLSAQADMEPVAEAATAQGAALQARWLQPDLLLVGAQTWRDDEARCLARLKEELPGLAIIVLGSARVPHDDDGSSDDGVDAYLSDETDLRQLLATIRRVCQEKAQLRAPC